MGQQSSPRPPLERHQVVAEYHRRTTIRPLRPAVPPPGAELHEATTLPLIVTEPCWVRLGDQCFRLRGEGLYRLWHWGQTRQEAPARPPQWLPGPRQYVNVILYRRDLLALLGALATVQCHGHRHISLSLAERVEHLRRGTLSLTCGPSSEFVRDLLTPLGWRLRPVSCVRVQGPWTGWNDGHVLNEIYWPARRQWVLLDVNAHRMFQREGQLLSAGEVTRLVRRGESFEFLWLTARGLPLVDTTPDILGEFPASSLGLGSWVDDTAMAASLGELLRMPLLAAEGQAWFYSDNPSHVRRILAYRTDARVLPEEEWFRRFYGPGAEPSGRVPGREAE